MTRAVLLASTAMLLLGTHAFAGQPASLTTSPNSDHIKVVTYSPTKRTPITGLVGQPTTITFPASENVYRVLQSGKPTKDGGLEDAGWQTNDKKEVEHSPLGNNMTIWPRAPGITIMNVTTMTKEGNQKTYAFQLIAHPDPDGKPDDPEAVFNVIFKGGGDPVISSRPTAQIADRNDRDDPPPKPKRRSAERSAREENARALAADKLRTDSFNASNDCHYHAKGIQPNPLEPRCPLDNGMWTIMRFPGLTAKPAVYIVGNDGELRLPRQTAAGDFVMIQEIAAHFRLLLVPDVLDIYNDAYNAVGTPNSTSTIAQSVNRQILHEKRQ